MLSYTMNIQVKVSGTKKLDRLISRLENIEAFVLAEADKIIDRDRQLFVEQNQGQLIETGTGSDGEVLEFKFPRKSKVRGAYTEPYAKYKERRGGSTAYVDLLLEGDFSRSIVLLQEGPNNWKFDSLNVKYKWLRVAYGEAILGVNDTFLDNYSENKMEPQLQTKVEKYL